MAVDPLHLRAAGLEISDGLTIPFPQLCEAPLCGSGTAAGVAVSPFKCFLFTNQPHMSPEASKPSRDSLPAFALLNHAFDTVHSTVRARDFSICCDMVSLHHVASNLSRSTCCASFRRPPLDRLWVSIAVNARSRLPSLFRARVGRTWGLRSIGAVGLN